MCGGAYGLRPLAPNVLAPDRLVLYLLTSVRLAWVRSDPDRLASVRLARVRLAWERSVSERLAP